MSKWRDEEKCMWRYGLITWALNQPSLYSPWAVCSDLIDKCNDYRMQQWWGALTTRQRNRIYNEISKKREERGSPGPRSRELPNKKGIVVER